MSVSTWYVNHYCTAQCQDLKCLDQKVRPGVLGTGIPHLIQREKKKIQLLLNQRETASRKKSARERQWAQVLSPENKSCQIWHPGEKKTLTLQSYHHIIYCLWTWEVLFLYLGHACCVSALKQAPRQSLLLLQTYCSCSITWCPPLLKTEPVQACTFHAGNW